MPSTNVAETLVPLALISAPVALAFSEGPQLPAVPAAVGAPSARSVPRAPAAVPPATVSQTAYTLGTWNLEHFKEGKTRGFPETPGLPARTDADIAYMASVIRDELDAKVLALQEVGAIDVDEDGEVDVRSVELQRLIGHLGESWDYAIGESGGSQHLAVLYDKNAVQLNSACEMSLPNPRVQKKGLFDRQPLFAHVTLLEDGKSRNDLVIVAVHLASGQANHRNHDAAISKMLDELAAAQKEAFCIPKGERDYVIMGDFNASRFDGFRETFWDAMEGNGWDVLADEEAQYSPTRLSGKPLRLKSSRIDYVIVSSQPGGLQGEEVKQARATVHTELVKIGADKLRLQASDHLPVTIDVHLATDTD